MLLQTYNKFDFRFYASVIGILLCFSSAVFAQDSGFGRERKAEELSDRATALTKRNTVESNRRALTLLLSAQKTYQLTANKRGEAKTAFEIGRIYQNLSERRAALDYYKRALDLFSELSDTFNKAQTLNNIGVVYSSLGKEDSALDYYNSALNAFKEIDEFDAAIPTMNNIAGIYKRRGDKKNALFYYELALPHLEKNGDVGKIASVYNNVGRLYADFAEYKTALAKFSEALPLHRKAGNKLGESSTLDNIGTVYRKTAEYEKAVGYFNQSLVIKKTYGDKTGEAITLNNLMFAWESLEKPDAAIFFGKQSINLYQQLRLEIQNQENETQKNYLEKIAGTYRNLSDLMIMRGRFAQAEQVLRFLKEDEFFDFVRRDADEIKNLGQQVELSEKEKEIIEKYSVLADKLIEIGRKFQTLDDKKRLLSRQNKTLSAAEREIYDKLSADLSVANAAFKLFVEKQLVREIGANAAQDIEYDRNLQAKLKKWGDGTVALYTVITDEHYRIVLTTPTVQISGKTEINSAVLNKKIFAFRAALQDYETDPRPLAKELYDILIKPIETDLQKAGAKTLIWSLDGSLRYIPLAALSPDGKNYLVEKYQNVIITPKTRDDLSDSDAEWQALGVGVSEGRTITDPENSSEEINFSPLPGSRNELQKIIKDENATNETGILTGKRFMDGDFTMRSFSDALAAENANGKRKYSVIHIASHFRLGSDWSNSFLLLGDGKILTLEDIGNSPEISFGDVELVTLSACDTAFADDSGGGGEMESLASVIQTKSGKSVLAALWAVADESTSLLMSEFYRLRKENPQMTKAEALQTAQISLINGTPSGDTGNTARRDNGKLPGNFAYDPSKPFNHPFFWSPFVLIGNWR